jgi:hypothetical protein
MFAVSAKCMARSLAVCMPLCLAAGAYARQVPEPLVEVWVTPKPLKSVQACVIKALDTSERTYSRISPSVRHVAKIRVPDSIVEIRPVKKDALADVSHYVRLEKIADVITRVAFYSADQSKQTMAKALSTCGPG